MLVPQVPSLISPYHITFCDQELYLICWNGRLSFHSLRTNFVNHTWTGQSLHCCWCMHMYIVCKDVNIHFPYLFQLNLEETWIGEYLRFRKLGYSCSIAESHEFGDNFGEPQSWFDSSWSLLLHFCIIINYPLQSGCSPAGWMIKNHCYFSDAYECLACL